MAYELPDLLSGFDSVEQRVECGVDEVGRGPLAGPVVAAAVVLSLDHRIEGIGDSKQLTAQRRNYLAKSIRDTSIAWSLGRCEPEEIDELNILRASLLAMERAVSRIGANFDVAMVDGNIAPNLRCPTVTIVGGDAKIQSIGAASILAKVARDEEMINASARYPNYGFQRNKGYPTPQHLEALKFHGPCPIHRMSFRPVADAILSRNDTDNVGLTTHK